MIRRPPRSTQSRSSAASDVYKRQGQEHPGVALAERRVVGRVDLVVDVLGAVQVLDVAAAALDHVDQALDAVFGEQPLEVQQRDAVVAAEHRHGTDPVSYT